LKEYNINLPIVLAGFVVDKGCRKMLVAPSFNFFGAVHFLAPFGHRREGF